MEVFRIDLHDALVTAIACDSNFESVFHQRLVAMLKAIDNDEQIEIIGSSEDY